MTTLYYGYEHTEIEYTWLDTPQEAASFALSMLEAGNGWPERIEHDGKTIWESRGPISPITSELEAIAQEKTTKL